jgi:hypothetical protein
MQVYISPNDMGALAAGASLALELLPKVRTYNETIREGLREAEHFCKILDQGRTARASTTNHFSADGLAAGRFLDMVFRMPTGEELTLRLPEIKSGLQKIMDSSTAETTPSAEVIELSRTLQAYFDTFATCLPFYEAVRSRVTADLRRRA